MKPKYSHSAHCVHNIGRHMIWCTKYRKKLIYGEIETYLKRLVRPAGHGAFPAAQEMRSTRPMEQVLLLRKRRTHIPGYGPTLYRTSKTKVTCSALICGLMAIQHLFSISRKAVFLSNSLPWNMERVMCGRHVADDTSLRTPLEILP